MHLLLGTLNVANKRELRNQVGRTYLTQQIVRQPIFILPGFVILALLLITKINPKARTQHRLGFEQPLQARNRDSRAVEKGRVGPKTHSSTSIAQPHFSGCFQRPGRYTVAKNHPVFTTAALDRDLQLGGQRINYRDANAVETAGVGIGFIREFAASVETGHDHLHRADLLTLVLVDRHAATIIGHTGRTILVQHYLDAVCMASDGLIHAVVYHLLHQVIGPLSLGIHARPAAHGLQAGKNFYC